MQQFDAQRSRGTEGFGLFDGQELNMVKASKEDKILKWLVKYDSDLILFHHRRPTSTINVKRAAHPFSTKDYFGDNQYIMVHNGYITNAEDLFCDHQELGIDYRTLLEDLTFNDSEALLWDLALTLEGKQDALVARGAIAFVCMKLHKGKLDKLYFGRNVNPLNLFRHKGGIALSSEGEGKPIEPNTLYTFNYNKRRLTQRHFQINQYAPYYNNGQSHMPYANDPYEHENQWEYKGSLDDPGGWLPPYLRRKFQNLVSNNHDLIDYDRDGNPLTYEDPVSGLLLPSAAATTFTNEEEDEIEAMFMPTDTEVNTKALEYLIRSKGNFEQAYWQVEQDYEDLELQDWGDENVLQRNLLEGVMQYFMNNPEYVNEHSISSMWEAIWSQQQLVA